MKTKKGFIPKYGSGEIPMRLNDFLFSADTGNIKLLFDDSKAIEFNHTLGRDKNEANLIEQYGDYGVKNIIHKFTCTEVEITELNEDEKRYT